MLTEVSKESLIKIKVGLNDKNVPVNIEWEAEDNPELASQQTAKAMLLSVFDKHSLETLKIDLWTTEMQIMEMDRFIYQTMRSLADTYQKATSNNDLANDMQRFAYYFGEKTGIIPK
jgi:gliding motility-associated protein GldC